jgi:hypothetical protein
VAGALAVGEPVHFSPQAQLLAISPDQSRLLIGRGPSSPLAIAALSPDGIGPESSIPGSLASADMAAFSPSGDSAAVRSTELGKVQVITGLAASPRVAFEFDIAALASEVRSIAVSDDGAFAILGASDGLSGSVQLFSRDGARTPLLQAGHPSSIQLLSGSAKAIVVDTAWNQVTLLDDVLGKATVRVFPAPPESEPSSLDGAVLSPNGGTLFVLCSGDRQAFSINLTDNSVSRSDFPSAATDSGRLAGTSFMVRSSADGKTAWLVDFSTPEPFSRYIPPIPTVWDGSVQEVEK